MSLPSENHQPLGRADDRLIDRLVDGELADAERRALLLWLATQPDGWRRCALAFLEAQALREALGPLAAPGRGVARPGVVPGGHGRTSKPRRRAVARLAALAAGLAAAFALGWALHGRSVEDAPRVALGPGESAAPAAPSEPPRRAPGELVAGESRPSEPGAPPTLLDPVVKQWEQRGYRAERQDRRVSLELKDGRRLDVPVHEVRLRYVGGRTY
jgi:anti-sigma factor RsiW